MSTAANSANAFNEPQNLSEAELLVWRAYAHHVQRMLLADNRPVFGQDYVFVLPPTQHCVRGGRPCPDTVTNYQVFDVADSLQEPDSPLFMIQSAGSYVDMLEQYLYTVETKDPTWQQREKYNRMRDQLHIAEYLRDKNKGDAESRWIHDPEVRHKKIPFSVWAADNAQTYLQYRDDAKLRAGESRKMQQEMFGTDAKMIQEKLKNIEEKAKDETKPVPGYNMPCYPFDYEISDDDLKYDTKKEITDPTMLLYRPLYAIDGYENVCDAWITGKAGPDTHWTLDWSHFEARDWSDLGHSQRIHAQANANYFVMSVLSGKDQVQHMDFGSESAMKNTFIDIRMSGPAHVVDIRAGMWDVPGVRRMFPHLIAGETDKLAGLVRVHKLLVGYQVTLTARFDKSMSSQIQKMLDIAHQDQSASLRFFGFNFGARYEQNEWGISRSLNDISFNAETSELVITATPAGFPVLLGAMGRKIL